MFQLMYDSLHCLLRRPSHRVAEGMVRWATRYCCILQRLDGTSDRAILLRSYPYQRLKKFQQKNSLCKHYGNGCYKQQCGNSRSQQICLILPQVGSWTLKRRPICLTRDTEHLQYQQTFLQTLLVNRRLSTSQNKLTVLRCWLHRKTFSSFKICFQDIFINLGKIFLTNECIIRHITHMFAVNQNCAASNSLFRYLKY